DRAVGPRRRHPGQGPFGLLGAPSAAAEPPAARFRGQLHGAALVEPAELRRALAQTLAAVGAFRDVRTYLGAAVLADDVEVDFRHAPKDSQAEGAGATLRARLSVRWGFPGAPRCPRRRP